MVTEPRIGIVGAGITGLTLHATLREAGFETQVFERRDRVGGVVETRDDDGAILDVGAQRTRLTPGVRTLLETVGLGDQVIEASEQPLFVVRNGDLAPVPTSVTGLLRTDALSWSGKCRLLMEPLTGGPPEAGETVESYLTRAFGSEFATRIGGPLYAGLYGSDPSRMPVEHSLARAFERFGIEGSLVRYAVRAKLQGRSPPPMITLRDGMAALPRAIAETYSEGIRMGTTVEAVDQTEGDVTVTTDAGESTLDALVSTTPAETAGDMLVGITPEAANALRSLTYNPLVTVHLRGEPGALTGAGHKIPRSTGYETRGVTWSDSLFGGHAIGGDPTGREGIYTSYLGGMGKTDHLSWTDDRLGDVAASEFDAITGESVEPIAVTRITPGMPAYDESWDILESVMLPSNVHLCANFTDRAGIPGRIRAARELGELVIEAHG